ncbi:hypothetical protein D3C77_645760 [compost metagenome]
MRQIVGKHLVKQAPVQGGSRVDGIALGNHRQRPLNPNDTRQPLRAARTGQHAQLHFGQAQRRAVQRHAIVATQRQFQPATQCRAVYRRDHGLGRPFNQRDH